jgi:hypothetical protein
VNELAAIQALLGSLKSAADIAKGFATLRDGALVQGKVIELQGVILAAQQGAMAAQSSQYALTEQVRQLEKQKAELEAWDAEKVRYKLTQLPPGVFVYSLKEEAANGEPIHSICPKCYGDRKKSLLHSSGKTQGLEDLRCLECNSTIRAGVFQRPTPTRGAMDSRVWESDGF